ncbi:MAG: sister chromatid cohesion protein PDS5 [Candidatus Thorarchaeota archaeon]
MSASLEQLLRDARTDLVMARIEKDPSVINEVIEQLNSDIRSIRFNSIYVLGELGEKAGSTAATQVQKYLKDEDWSIRREAARTLGKMGYIANHSIPDLKSLITDKEITIRHAVVSSLGKICDPTTDCINTLKEALMDKDINVRAEAAKSLGLLGPDAYEVIPNLMNSMRDPNWNVRTESAMAIRGIGKGTIKAIPTLINALSDNDWRVRYRVINTLVEIGEPAIPHLVNILNHRNKIVRKGALEALGELKVSNPEILEKISNLLKDKVEDVRGKAADSLRNIGQPAIPFIIKTYDKRFIPIKLKTIFYIIFWLFILVSDIWFVILLSNTWFYYTLFIIPPIYIILVIVDVIRYGMGDYLWIFKLFDYKNKRKELLLSSIGGIGLGNEESIQFVIEQLKSKKNYIRLEAARTLGKIGKGSKNSLNALIATLNDENSSVRREAALSLGKLGSFAVDAIPFLINKLDDKNKDVRWRSTEALGKINIRSEQVISALEGAIHDECDYVCEAAELAIDSLSETK